MPVMRLRVVCGFGETIAIFFPRIRFEKRGLPTLGGPTIAIKPDKNFIVFPPQSFLTAGNRRQDSINSALVFSSILRTPSFACTLSGENFFRGHSNGDFFALHPAPVKRLRFSAGTSPNAPNVAETLVPGPHRPQPALSLSGMETP